MNSRDAFLLAAAATAAVAEEEEESEPQPQRQWRKPSKAIECLPMDTWAHILGFIHFTSGFDVLPQTAAADDDRGGRMGRRHTNRKTIRTFTAISSTSKFFHDRLLSDKNEMLWREYLRGLTQRRGNKGRRGEMPYEGEEEGKKQEEEEASDGSHASLQPLASLQISSSYIGRLITYGPHVTCEVLERVKALVDAEKRRRELRAAIEEPVTGVVLASSPPSPMLLHKISEIEEVMLRISSVEVSSFLHGDADDDKNGGHGVDDQELQIWTWKYVFLHHWCTQHMCAICADKHSSSNTPFVHFPTYERVRQGKRPKKKKSLTGATAANPLDVDAEGGDEERDDEQAQREEDRISLSPADLIILLIVCPFSGVGICIKCLREHFVPIKDAEMLFLRKFSSSPGGGRSSGKKEVAAFLRDRLRSYRMHRWVCYSRLALRALFGDVKRDHHRMEEEQEKVEKRESVDDDEKRATEGRRSSTGGVHILHNNSKRERSAYSSALAAMDDAAAGGGGVGVGEGGGGGEGEPPQLRGGEDDDEEASHHHHHHTQQQQSYRRNLGGGVYLAAQLRSTFEKHEGRSCANVPAQTTDEDSDENEGALQPAGPPDPMGILRWRGHRLQPPMQC